MDAVAMTLLGIGEAVKSLSIEITNSEPEIKWRDIAGMRDLLANHYFATNPEVVEAVIDKDLQPLADSVARMRSRLPDAAEPTTLLSPRVFRPSRRAGPTRLRSSRRSPADSSRTPRGLAWLRPGEPGPLYMG